MELEELVTSLNLPSDGYQEEDKFIIDLVDSNEYSKIYTLLDSSELLDIDEAATLLTDKVGELQFFNDEFNIKLVGNFTSDIYRVVITRGE